MNEAENYFRKGDYRSSVKYSTEALRHAENTKSNREEKIAASLHNLGLISQYL